MHKLVKELTTRGSLAYSSLPQISEVSVLRNPLTTQVKDANPTSRKISSYVGIDPTANQIHLGNYLQIIANARGSLHGIHQIYLIGGATGRIGDPSGKSSERTMLGDELVNRFSHDMTTQLETVLANLYAYIGQTKGGEIRR